MSALPWKRSWFGQRWLAAAAVAVALALAVALAAVAGGEAASAATSSGACASLRAMATTCGSGGMQTQGVRWQ